MTLLIKLEQFALKLGCSKGDALRTTAGAGCPSGWYWQQTGDWRERSFLYAGCWRTDDRLRCGQLIY